MTIWWYALVLLGQSEWIKRFRLRSNSNSTSIISALALVGGVIVLVWIAANWMRWNERRRQHCPRALFKQLARAHGLSSAERNLLLRIACEQQPYNPAVLFVEPQRFATEQLSANLEPDSAQIQRLHEKLFGSLGSN
jgi:predicted ATPase